MHARLLLLCLAATLIATLLTVPASSQNLTSGDVAGTVTDPSGAILPNATVTLKNNATGQTITVTTNATGGYRFSLLAPGSYTVTANAAGFQTTSQPVTVAVGQATTANMQLTVGASSQTVEVTAEGGWCRRRTETSRLRSAPSRCN